MANKSIQTDVAILGAGLVGLTAAIAFSKLGYTVTLIDSKPLTKRMQKAYDARIYALTEASQRWLADTGLWLHVDSKRVNPIDEMCLWQGNAEQPDVILDAETANLAQMGCIVESQNLMVAAWKAIKTTDVTIITDVTAQQIDNKLGTHCELLLSSGKTVQAKLLLAADGANSWVRQQLNIGVKTKAFNQTAIVANFESDVAHHNVAKQWFGPHETLALLPLPNDAVSLVWSLSTELAEKQLNNKDFSLAELVIERTNLPSGSLKMVDSVNKFPLRQRVVNQLIVERCALLGDAAHQVHPMAGQGVNLGFKGVMALEQAIAQLTSLQDIGDYHVLRQYERTVKQGVAELTSVTSGLDALFAMENKQLGTFIQKGMHWLDQSTLLKKHIVKHASL